MGLTKANQTSFKKGFTPWNKGLVGYENKGTFKKGHRGYNGMLGKKHSEETKEKLREIGLQRLDEKAGGWKGSSVGYSGIHHWLVKKYGKANCCLNKKCTGKSVRYVWALLRDKTYDRKRENFIELCNSCHMKYDLDFRYNLALWKKF